MLDDLYTEPIERASGGGGWRAGSGGGGGAAPVGPELEAQPEADACVWPGAAHIRKPAYGSGASAASAPSRGAAGGSGSAAAAPAGLVAGSPAPAHAPLPLSRSTSFRQERDRAPSPMYDPAGSRSALGATFPPPSAHEHPGVAAACAGGRPSQAQLRGGVQPRDSEVRRCGGGSAAETAEALGSRNDSALTATATAGQDLRIAEELQEITLDDLPVPLRPSPPRSHPLGGSASCASSLFNHR